MATEEYARPELLAEPDKLDWVGRHLHPIR